MSDNPIRQRRTGWRRLPWQGRRQTPRTNERCLSSVDNDVPTPQTRAELIAGAADLAAAAGAPPMQGLPSGLPSRARRRAAPTHARRPAVVGRGAARTRPAPLPPAHRLGALLQPDARHIDGWTSSHTVVQIVTDDIKFLVDSVQCRARHHAARDPFEHSPVPAGRARRHRRPGRHHRRRCRYQAGRAVGVLAESWMHVRRSTEVTSDRGRDRRPVARRALRCPGKPSGNWPKMRARAWQVAADITADPSAGDRRR